MQQKTDEEKTIRILQKSKLQGHDIIDALFVELCANYCRFNYESNLNQREEDDIVPPEECDHCIFMMLCGCGYRE